MKYQTDLSIIATHAIEREDENIDFHSFINQRSIAQLDTIVHEINDQVSAGIDCTQCGNCCNSLVINVTEDDMIRSAQALNIDKEEFKATYIEESLQGELYINTIPCHFFKDKKCTIYTSRFKECRDFPHLHKPGFQQRLLGTLLHYGRCPIIYNVLEELKVRVGFRDA